jgi:flagellar protein FlaG
VPADVSAARIEALVKDLNSALENVDGDYSVSVDSDTGMVIVRITDVETGEIVKQVPPQQVLDVSMSVEKIIGLLINDQG